MHVRKLLKIHGALADLRLTLRRWGRVLYQVSDHAALGHVIGGGILAVAAVVLSRC